MQPAESTMQTADIEDFFLLYINKLYLILYMVLSWST